MTNAIADTLAAARAAAEAATANNDNYAATSNAYVPATVAPAAKMPSLREAAQSGGLVVDGWLTVTPDGFKIGPDGDLMKTLTVNLNLAEVVPTLNARGEAGGRAIYARSTDGVRDVTGKPWSLALQNVQKSSAPDKFVEYNSYEIPMALTTKVGALDVGKSIGFTPAMMAAKDFSKFVNSTPPELDSAGPVKVVLTHVKKKGAGPAYGVIDFSLAA